MQPETLKRAVGLLEAADGLLITAGAGMGVDSGLPDFRGDQGFWQAYPALGRAGLRFSEVASPATFLRRPRLAWGFYGHRLHLYRQTAPHAGFHILRRWAQRFAHGAFIYTSNVDGQFQKAGFDPERIVECHGSIHHLQCVDNCCGDTWSAASVTNAVDEARCLMLGELPRCICCAGLARPNILMFGDGAWVEARTVRQRHRFQHWLASVQRLVVVELGAGTAIPSARMTGERSGAPLIRINPCEPDVPRRTDVGIDAGALAALQAIDRQWSSAGQCEALRLERAMGASLLNDAERAQLVERHALEVGRYHDPRKGTRQVDMRRSAAGLVELIDDVARNRRVYEFMSIQRPGDLLAYLRLFLLPGDEFLQRELRASVDWLLHDQTEFSVTELDRILPWQGEDTLPLAETWQACRDGVLWREWPWQLLALMRTVQQREREREDILLRCELALMEAGRHRRDFWAGISRAEQAHELPDPILPAAVAQAVVSLTRQLGLPAVAADECGIDFWRALCALQMERSQARGVGPGEALALLAADRGVPLTAADWGGEVFVSWEGMRVATLTVLPSWRVFNADGARELGSFASVLSQPEWDAPMVVCGNGYRCRQDECLVLVTERNFGDFAFAQRVCIEGWTLYVSNAVLAPGDELPRLCGLHPEQAGG